MEEEHASAVEAFEGRLAEAAQVQATMKTEGEQLGAERDGLAENLQQVQASLEQVLVSVDCGEG